MSNYRYNTPSEGSLDWHIPLNENFDQLGRDVEIRDIEANRTNYEPKAGAKFFATDSGATYSGDGSTWKLVGYIARAVSAGLGHYANYGDGLEDEPINEFLLDSDEKLEVTRLSFPMKGVGEGSTESNAKLRVYEGGVGSDLLVEIDGNSYTAAVADSSAPWVTTSSPVTVTISNATGGPIDASPKVWANIRR